jgi:hypothetical protein
VTDRKLSVGMVHEIRTRRFTDSYWARCLKVTNGTVRRARTGETYADHPTSADRAPRDGTGRGNNRIAKAARVRRSYFRE